MPSDTICVCVSHRPLKFLPVLQSAAVSWTEISFIYVCNTHCVWKNQLSELRFRLLPKFEKSKNLLWYTSWVKLPSGFLCGFMALPFSFALYFSAELFSECFHDSSFLSLKLQVSQSSTRKAFGFFWFASPGNGNLLLDGWEFQRELFWWKIFVRGFPFAVWWLSKAMTIVQNPFNVLKASLNA